MINTAIQLFELHLCHCDSVLFFDPNAWLNDVGHSAVLILLVRKVLSKAYFRRFVEGIPRLSNFTTVKKCAVVT